MAIVAIDRRAPKKNKLTDNGTPTQTSEPAHNGTPTQISVPTHTGTPTETGEPAHNGTPTETGEPTQISEPTHTGTPTDTGEPAHNGAPTETGEPTQISEPTHTGTPTDTGEPAHNGEPIQISEPTPASELTQPFAARSKGGTPRTNSTRRALAITGLGGLLIAGVTVITTSGSGTGPSANGPGGGAFENARAGDCLSWPKNSPDQAHLVDCSADHLFEVAQAVDVSDSQEGCQAAVQRYLGTRYDPNGKFAIGVLRPGNAPGSPPAGQHVLCGLQLPGSDRAPVAFKGKIAQLDQSRVWPAGTCLAIDPSSTLADIPVGCAAPHAVEVTDAVNLADTWPDAPPADPDQEAFVRDTCIRATDAYLSPVAVSATGLTMIYSTVPLPSWLAGSRQVFCAIGAPQGGGWATLSGSAKDRLLINGVTPGPRPPAPPQDTPDQRPTAPSTAASSPSPAPSATASPSASTTASPSASTTASPAPSLTAGPAAIPSPAPPPNPSSLPPTTSEADAPQVIEIPGLPPITLPRLFPPPPPPPGD